MKGSGGCTLLGNKVLLQEIRITGSKLKTARVIALPWHSIFLPTANFCAVHTKVQIITRLKLGICDLLYTTCSRVRQCQTVRYDDDDDGLMLENRQNFI